MDHQNTRRVIARIAFAICAAILLLGAAVMYGVNERGFTTLPDGSRIKLLAITTGKRHQVKWQYFSFANALRKYSSEFGPYVTPVATELDTTSSVDSVVFWTRRVFGEVNARPISAFVIDENGNRDRIATGPFPTTVLRDRVAPVGKGVVMGWAVPRSAFWGNTLKLQICERPQTTTEPVSALVSYESSNPYHVAAETNETTGEQKLTDTTSVSLDKLISGVPYPVPQGLGDFFRPGPREFMGTSVSLRLDGPAAGHRFVARHIRARSAGGIEFTVRNFLQSRAQDRLNISFPGTCSNDQWELQIELADETSSPTQTTYIDNVATENELTSEDDGPGTWYYGTRAVVLPGGGTLNLHVRCGPVDDNKLMFTLSSAEPRLPLLVSKILDEEGNSLPFELDDPFNARCWLQKRSKLRIKLSHWPTSSVRFVQKPEIILPEIVPAKT